MSQCNSENGVPDWQFTIHCFLFLPKPRFTCDNIPQISEVCCWRFLVRKHQENEFSGVFYLGKYLFLQLQKELSTEYEVFTDSFLVLNHPRIFHCQVASVALKRRLKPFICCLQTKTSSEDPFVLCAHGWITLYWVWLSKTHTVCSNFSSIHLP